MSAIPVRSIAERNELVEANAGFTVLAATRLGETAGEREDELQEAFLGTIRAAEKFDPRYGAFTTYVDPWVRKKVKECRYDSRVPVRFPKYQHCRIGVYRREEERLSHALRRLPAFEEVADAMGLPESQWGALRDALTAEDRFSADEPPVDPPTCPPGPLDTLATAEEAGFVRDALVELERDDPTAAAAVRLRFWGNDGDGLYHSEIGSRWGTSKESARQHVLRGLAKLRELMIDRGVTE